MSCLFVESGGNGSFFIKHGTSSQCVDQPKVNTLQKTGNAQEEQCSSKSLSTSTSHGEFWHFKGIVWGLELVVATSVVIVTESAARRQWDRCLSFSRSCGLDLCQKQISIVDRVHIQWNRDLMQWINDGLSVQTEARNCNCLFRGDAAEEWKLYMEITRSVQCYVEIIASSDKVFVGVYFCLKTKLIQRQLWHTASTERNCISIVSWWTRQPSPRLSVVCWGDRGYVQRRMVFTNKHCQ